jgi:hypothetical protein
VDTFSWESLTNRPASTEALDGFSAGSLIAFAILFLATAALAIWPRRWRLYRHLGRMRYGRWLTTGAWIAALGLIFLIMRFIQVDPFTLGRPIWLVLSWVAILAWLVWLLWMLRGVPARAESTTPLARRPRKGGQYR